MAGRVARPSRVPTAGVRDPVPGLSLRAGRPLSQARSRAPRTTRAGLLRHPAVRPVLRDLRATGPAAGRPSRPAVGRHGPPVSRAAAEDRLVRGHGRPPPPGLSVVEDNGRAPAAGP